MKTAKYLLLIIFTGLFSADLYSQSIIRQSINSFGKSNQTEGGLICETVGQAYFTMVSMESDILLHPGFQQKMTSFLKGGEAWGDLQINLFPNPVSEELYLNTNEAIENAKIEIFDIQGKVVLLVEHDKLSEMIFHLGEFSDGLYTIKITDIKRRKSFNSRIIILK